MPQRLRESIDELARRDRRYPADAYLLVFEGLELALDRQPVRRHVAPLELVEAIRDKAHEQWGYLAQAVLLSWNVRSPGDVGDMVFNLVDRGLLVASDDDTRADFDVPMDFTTTFEQAFLADLDRNPPRVGIL